MGIQTPCICFILKDIKCKVILLPSINVTRYIIEQKSKSLFSLRVMCVQNYTQHRQYSKCSTSTSDKVDLCGGTWVFLLGVVDGPLITMVRGYLEIDGITPQGFLHGGRQN